MDKACSICARVFAAPDAPTVEKQPLVGRDLPCCERAICIQCLNKNKRYETYCPYCQISSQPSVLPQGLKDPPSYGSLDQTRRSLASIISNNAEDRPPAYSEHHSDDHVATKDKGGDAAPDVLHFVAPGDSVRSLSLAYNVPIDALRKTNNLFADNLLQGRRTILIPGAYYKGGVSLSPRPIEGEEEEARKQKVRRWMVASKVAEYDVALLYLDQSEWNLEAAITAYTDDEQWERDHPIQAKQRVRAGKTAGNVGMRRFVGNRQ